MKAGVRYPQATIAVYGPDYRTATKLVVSIFKRPEDQAPVAMEKWTVAGGDIRSDAEVSEAVQRFIQSHQASETLRPGWVLGCPHEEGVDYPVAGTCPQCPFWANLDHHTLDPKSLDLPLTPEQIMAGLSYERITPPLLSLAAAENHREEMTEPFLQAVERALAKPDEVSAEDALLFPYVLAFLGKWREPRALPLVIRWLTLPPDLTAELCGALIYLWGPRLLASVCAGNPEPLKQLVQDRSADKNLRGQAIAALAMLVAWNDRSQGEMAEYFGWLAREGLERNPGHTWNMLAASCVDIEALATFDDLRRALAEGLVGENYLEPDELGLVVAGPRGGQLESFRRCHYPFEDVAFETGWDADFADADPPEDFDAGVTTPRVDDQGIPQPYVAPPKIGRNAPCPCGSGKKYKKCCGA